MFVQRRILERFKRVNEEESQIVNILNNLGFFHVNYGIYYYNNSKDYMKGGVKVDLFGQGAEISLGHSLAYPIRDGNEKLILVWEEFVNKIKNLESKYKFYLYEKGDKNSYGGFNKIRLFIENIDNFVKNNKNEFIEFINIFITTYHKLFDELGY